MEQSTAPVVPGKKVVILSKLKRYRVLLDRLQALMVAVGWVLLTGAFSLQAIGQPATGPGTDLKAAASAAPRGPAPARSIRYAEVQQRLAQGWNTWDVHSVTTHVLLPQGLAIHVGMQHNSTESGDAFLSDALIGRLAPGAEQVFPGPHDWRGDYTDLKVSWKQHNWRVRSAHDGNDLVLLATPLPSAGTGALPPTIVFSVDFLWNRRGTAERLQDFVETHSASGDLRIYCTCTGSLGAGALADQPRVNLPVRGAYFATDFTRPVALSTGRPRTLAEVGATLDRERAAYEHSLGSKAETRPIVDAIETTLGWDTIYEPSAQRVVSPVSRVWSVDWGGYVIFDWDTFFAASMAAIGDRDLAYADTMETLRESTTQGFVPNYARGGNWKSTDRSEPPVGAITVLDLYRKFGDRWLLEDAFPYLLRWNQWWAEHRDMDGYMAWGSDGGNEPANLDDGSRGTRLGAILESGLDNSPMYDSATYNKQTHLLEFADVGLMSMYIADCEALATIADTLGHADEAKQLRLRSARYRARLQTLWSPERGIFLNKDLHTGAWSTRLSPTNFYPMLAQAATPAQAERMLHEHLLNPKEFWGDWILPSIERDDPAFKDQDYWRGRIWGPMNYLVYLGLRNYDEPAIRKEFAGKSLTLFLAEWQKAGHVHENYNAATGSGDDVSNSDRFYHWGALLGLIEYMEQTEPVVQPAGPRGR